MIKLMEKKESTNYKFLIKLLEHIKNNSEDTFIQQIRCDLSLRELDRVDVNLSIYLPDYWKLVKDLDVN